MNPAKAEGHRWLVVVLYAVAMAWVEAAAVYYLRSLIHRIVPYQPYPLPVAGGFGAQIGGVPAKVLEMSYGGLRLELSMPPEKQPPPSIKVSLMSFGLSVNADVMWTSRVDPSGRTVSIHGLASVLRSPIGTVLVNATASTPGSCRALVVRSPTKTPARAGVYPCMPMSKDIASTRRLASKPTLTRVASCRLLRNNPAVASRTRLSAT